MVEIQMEWQAELGRFTDGLNHWRKWGDKKGATDDSYLTLQGWDN